MNKIQSFNGEYSFLSNFYECLVLYNGIAYNSSEAAFQAQKCESEKTRYEFAELTPAEAKKKGRKVKLRSDWNEIKIEIMRDIVLQKFAQHPDLRAKLIETGDTELIEGNHWNDTFWGVDTKTGVGENNLGKILMGTRDLFNQYNS